MDLQRVSKLVAFGRGEDDAGSQTGAHLRAIKVHPPMSGVWSWRQVLGLDLVDEEVSQCLGLDGGARLIEDDVGGQLDGPLGHPARCVSAAYDLRKRGGADNRDGVLLK